MSSDDMVETPKAWRLPMAIPGPRAHGQGGGNHANAGNTASADEEHREGDGYLPFSSSDGENESDTSSADEDAM